MTAIKVPPLGESIVEATVSRWLKKEGEAIAPGETLVELETDKITVEVPAMSGGVVTRRAHAEGDVVEPGFIHYGLLCPPNGPVLRSRWIEAESPWPAGGGL